MEEREMLYTHEIDMILEALDALKSKRAADSIMSHMLTVMLLPPGEDRESILEKEKEKTRNGEEGEKERVERITLLKAKLIKMSRECLTIFEGESEGGA